MTEHVRSLVEVSSRSFKTKQILLRTHVETVRSLDDMALRTGCTRTALIEFAICRLREEDVIARLQDIRGDVAYPFSINNTLTPQDNVVEVPDFE